MENMLEQFRSAWTKFCQLSLVVRIIIGLCIGIVLALVCPQATAVAYLGKMFVGALKGLAPILVFVLVAASLAQHNGEMKNNVGKVVCLYVIGMLLA
ncbi:MAG: serine/threonine transporter SstT, partial [Candidatus Bruticola sp.]